MNFLHDIAEESGGPLILSDFLLAMVCVLVLIAMVVLS